MIERTEIRKEYKKLTEGGMLHIQAVNQIVSETGLSYRTILDILGERE